jgi:HK97 family phage prohead protease
MEYKILPTFTKSVEGRTVTGIFAVHGNIDSYGDISHPGSFIKTIQERGPKVMHLWNHNTDMFAGPPVAKVLGLRELNREELPEVVLQIAPQATGGVEVTREYFDTPRANEVFAPVAAGAVTEMSYAYDPVKFDFSEVDGQRVRNLREMRLYETSDVLWGANAATVASKFAPDPDVFLKQLEGYIEAQVKAGARHSTADIKLLNAIHKAAVSLGATQCKGVVEEEEEDADNEKSRADLGNLSLTFLRAKAFLFET